MALWTLRIVVGGLWLVSAVWKGVRFHDQRIFLASFAGVPYGSLGAAVTALGAAEGVLGLFCVSGAAPRWVAGASLAVALAFVLAKGLWPRRGGSRPPCACVPWVRPRRSAPARLTALIQAVLPDLPVVVASAALLKASLP